MGGRERRGGREWVREEWGSGDGAGEGRSRVREGEERREKRGGESSKEQCMTD